MRHTQTFVRRHFPVVLLLLGFLLGVVQGVRAAGHWPGRPFSRLDEPFTRAPGKKAHGANNGGQGAVSAAQAPVYTFSSFNVPFAGARDTEAYGINNAGKIVGRYFDSTRGVERGFLDNAGVVTTIDIPFPNSKIFFVDSINDFDKIVGEYIGSDGRGHGFLDDAGVFKTIDFPAAIGTGAFGINNAGQIVGDYRDSARRLHGFLLSDLAAAYGLDEGSGTTASDSSGNGNTGTLVNTPTWTAGKFGSALSFNGVNQYVRVANAASLNITKDITITAWVKGLGTTYENPIVAKHNDATSWDYELWIPNNGVIQFWADGQSPQNVTSTVALPDRTNWHHVAVTRSAGTVTFYVDGAPAGSRAMSGTFHTNASPVDIGCDGAACNSKDGLLQGAVDEVRIYNRALSASEIQTVMSTAIGTTPPPPQGAQFSSIDVPGARSSAAIGTNMNGQIVGGFYDFSGFEHGFLYNKGQFSTIDIPGATDVEFEAVNNQGQIVGVYWDSAGAAHGVLYSQGQFLAIDVPGATGTGAYGINNLGQIVGVYADSAGNHAFIATPNP